MLACIDVGYSDAGAKAACVTFDIWHDARPSGEFTLDIRHVAPYIPGQFYRRELPCVLAVLDQLPSPPEIVVIDGYVYLDDQRRKGLGAHLFDALGQSIPIVGVAKTRFATATNAIEVLRGTSDRPLYVSAVGMTLTVAAECLRQMHGPHRIPTLLKRVDQLSRQPLDGS